MSIDDLDRPRVDSWRDSSTGSFGSISFEATEHRRVSHLAERGIVERSRNGCVPSEWFAVDLDAVVAGRRVGVGSGRSGQSRSGGAALRPRSLRGGRRRVHRPRERSVAAIAAMSSVHDPLDDVAARVEACRGVAGHVARAHDHRSRRPASSRPSLEAAIDSAMRLGLTTLEHSSSGSTHAAARGGRGVERLDELI